MTQKSFIPNSVRWFFVSFLREESSQTQALYSFTPTHCRSAANKPKLPKLVSNRLVAMGFRRTFHSTCCIIAARAMHGFRLPITVVGAFAENGSKEIMTSTICSARGLQQQKSTRHHAGTAQPTIKIHKIQMTPLPSRHQSCIFSPAAQQ